MLPTPFKNDDPFPTPEAAARKLVEIVKERQGDEPHSYTGVCNSDFLNTGSTVESYKRGRDYAIERGWISIDPSGTRITARET